MKQLIQLNVYLMITDREYILKDDAWHINIHKLTLKF